MYSINAMSGENNASNKRRYIWYDRFRGVTDDGIGHRIKVLLDVTFHLPQNIIYNYNHFDHLWR